MSDLGWYAAGIVTALVVTGQLAVLLGVVLLGAVAWVAMLAVRELDD